MSRFGEGLVFCLGRFGRGSKLGSLGVVQGWVMGILSLGEVVWSGNFWK